MGDCVLAVTMEPKYIIAIAAVGLFLVLFIIFFILLARKRKAEVRLLAWLQDYYSDKNLIKKADYETNGGDDIAVSADRSVRQFDDYSEPKGEEDDEVQLKIEEAFSKIETEGIEEITGYYNPQQ